MNGNYYSEYQFDNNQMIYPQAVDMYRQDNTMVYPQATNINQNDERFFWAPFVVGGLAGTALGYGIANNNQINGKGGCCMQPMPYYQQPIPVYPAPYMYSSSNNFYY